MRIRSIKPEFWRSADISALEWHTRLLFIGLWSYVDDNGVGVDREALIAADLFADDLSRDPRETFARVSEGLSELHSAGLIARYSVDSRDYLAIVTWKQHQRIDKPNKPRYPEPTSDYAEPRESVARVSRHLPETPAPGTGEQGSRGTGEQRSVVTVGGDTYGDQAPPSAAPQEFSAIPDAWIETPGLARCPAHQGDEYPPPCRGCATARETAEAEQRRRTTDAKHRGQARRDAIDACDLCDTVGHGVDETGQPVLPAVPCAHNETTNAERVTKVVEAEQRRTAEEEQRREAAREALHALGIRKRESDEPGEPEEVSRGPF